MSGYHDALENNLVGEFGLGPIAALTMATPVSPSENRGQKPAAQGLAAPVWSPRSVHFINTARVMESSQSQQPTDLPSATGSTAACCLLLLLRRRRRALS
jgi:hypothetical protein